MADSSVPTFSTSIFPFMMPNKPKTTADDPLIKPLPSPFVTISTDYQWALEQGRFLEQSIGDAQKEIQKFKKDLEDRIKSYLHQIWISISAELPLAGRIVALAKNIIDIIKEIINIIKEVQAAIKALIAIVQLLQALINKMIAQLQAIINALAALLNEICNWHLPRLPAIPNIFGSLTWGWNGFQLKGLKLQKLTFDKNFAFGHCSITPPDLNIFSNFPTSVQGSNGISFGNQMFNPPLGGILASLNPSPIYITQSLEPATNNTPILTNSFTTSDVNRSLPSPISVINNYFMPPTVYNENIVSFFPQFNDVTTTSQLAPLYAQIICLDNIINSNFDPNIVAAWLFYLNSSLTIRSGYWIKEFKELFEEVIEPSISYINADLPVTEAVIPFNFFNPTIITPGSPSYPDQSIAPSLSVGDSVSLVNNVWTSTSVFPTGQVYSSNQIAVAKFAPVDIPFISYVQSSTSQNNLLWRLTWLEAGLLGYPRSTTWDAYADTNFLSPITQTDLDFKSATLSSTFTSILLDQGGLAQYPPTISVPTSILSNVQKAIANGEALIEANPAWRTTTQYRYVYDSFAQQHEIDRYSQFWRVWAMNFNLLLHAGLVTPYAASYWQYIDSACNPLGDNQANYIYLNYDANNRNGSWVPGDGLPTIPTNLEATAQGSDYVVPGGTNGWVGDTFNPAQFLLRPDVANQPINVQMAMLSLNQCYASVVDQSTAVQTAINSQMATAQNDLAALASFSGFAVESLTDQVVPIQPTLIFPANIVNTTEGKTFIFNPPPSPGVPWPTSPDSPPPAPNNQSWGDSGMDMGPGAQGAPAWIDVGGLSNSIICPASGNFMLAGYFPFSASIGTNPSIKKVSVLVNDSIIAAGYADSVPAGSFAIGTEYTITSIGTTDFTKCGAASNTVGITFTPNISDTNPSGSGTGTAITGTISASEVTFTQYISLNTGDVIKFVMYHTDYMNPISLLGGYTVAVISSDSSNAVPFSTPEPALMVRHSYPSAEENLPPLTAVIINSSGKLQKVDVSVLPPNPSPWLSGVTLSSGDTEDNIHLALLHGTVYELPDSIFSSEDVGKTLYVQDDGSISTVFPKFTSGYVMVVGQVLSLNSFIYQPQLPLKKA